MNSFTGIFFPDNPTHPAIELLRKLAGNRNLQLQETDNLVIVCQEKAGRASNADWLVVCDASFYNKKEMARQWSSPDISLQESTPAEFILEGLTKKGTSFTDRLMGDFAVVAFHRATATLYCFRDQHGFRPLYYHQQNGLFFFSNHLPSLTSLPVVDQTPDMEFVADTLAGIKSDKERTSYQQIYRLLPAHFLEVQGRHLNLQRYWDFDLSKKIHYSREEDYVEAFRELLHEAITCRLDGGQVGAELSGGLDSSVIAATASGYLKQQHRSLQAFSHAHPPEMDGTDVFPKDEKTFIEQVLQHAGINEHWYVTAAERDILNSLQEGLRIQGGLFQQSLQVYSDALYDQAKKSGSTILLSGFGGDEGVTYQGAGFMNELAAGRHWQELWREIGSRGSSNRLKNLKRFLALWTGREIPPVYHLISSIMPERYDWRKVKFANLALTQGAISKYGIKKRYFSRVRFPDDDSVKVRQYKRMTHPHVSGRLEYCYLAAASRGLEYRYPLQDIRLQQFHLSVPARLKVKNGTGRYLYRRAVYDWVPETIRWRADKSGATIPTVFARFERDYENILQFLDENKELAADLINHQQLRKWADNIHNRVQANDPNSINPPAFYHNLATLIWLKEMR